VPEVKQERAGGLDGIRGVAVVLMLVDHVLVVLQTRWAPVLVARLVFTRPALPLFMVVSGSLLAKHGDGACGKQAVRILPWAMAGTIAAAFVPGFGFPEPLTIYLVGLGLVDLALTYDVVPIALCVCFVVALQPDLWPIPSYSPFELAGWLMVGYLAVEFRGDWWSRWDHKFPRVLQSLGRRSLYWYVGELVVIGAVCAGLGMRGYLL
jgi:hypothetical protein